MHIFSTNISIKLCHGDCGYFFRSDTLQFEIRVTSISSMFHIAKPIVLIFVLDRGQIDSPKYIWKLIVSSYSYMARNYNNTSLSKVSFFNIAIYL